MKSFRKSAKSRRNRRSRKDLENRKLLGAEKLELRVMLAADLQNQDFPQDVNGDGHAAPDDALEIINVLNGATSNEGTMLDVDGDTHVSPSDALRVINMINDPDAEPESTKVLTSMTVTDLEGNEITMVNEGDQFVVNTFVRDVRMGQRLGVFAIYQDVDYDRSIASVDLRENQRYIISGGPFEAGSTYTITVNGEETAPIAHDADIATVEAALEALDGVAVGEIDVVEDPDPGFKLIFGGDHANSDVDPITVDISGITTDPNDPFAVPPSVQVSEVSKGNVPIDPFNATFGTSFLNSFTSHDPYINGPTAIFGDRDPGADNTETIDDGILDLDVISELGSFAGTNTVGSGTLLQKSWHMTAHTATDCQVTMTISGSAADSVPASRTLLFSSGNEDLIVDPMDIIFGSVDIIVKKPVCAVDDAATVAEDSGATAIDVTANDVLNEGSSKSVNSFTQPANGQVAAGPTTDEVVYTPDANFFGMDTFTYEVIDDLGNTDTGTVTVTVTEINDAPVVVGDMDTTAEDTPLDIAVADLLNNDNTGPLEVGQTLSLDSFDMTTSAGGSVSNSNGTLTYTPPADFNGTDTFDYTIIDDGTTDGVADPLTDTGTVTITVTEVNDAPTAVQDDFTTPEDTPLTFDPAVLFANDSKGPANESGQMLSLFDFDMVGSQGGTLAINGTATYTPPADFFGTETFSYTIEDDGTTDGADDFLQSVSTISIDVTPVNDAPTAVADQFMVIQDSVDNLLDVAANDSAGPANESGQSLVAINVPLMSTEGGTLVNNNDGTVTYTPQAGFFGVDTFTYEIQDDGLTNGQADPMTDGPVTVTINVDPPRIPLARDDTLIVREDDPATDFEAQLLANDLGPDVGVLDITAVTDPPNGTASVSSVFYQPDPDFNGMDSFTYTLVAIPATPDGADMGDVTVIVQEVNDAPTANDDAVTAAEDTPLMFASSDLVTNDSKGPANESDQTLTVTAVDAMSAEGGTVTLANGVITYTPPANYNGPDSFDYTMSDDGTTAGAADPLTASATVNVTVTEVNDAPTAVDNDGFTTAEDTPLDILRSDLVADDSKGPANEAGQTLVVSAVSPMSANGGTVVFANGSVTYTPPQDFNGTDTFTYTVTDDGQTDGVDDFKSDIGTVTVVVTEVNDMPIAADDDDPKFLILKDGGAQEVMRFTDGMDVTPLTNDVPGPANESAQTLTIISVEDPVGGTTAIIDNGTGITFEPDPGFEGMVSFTYTIEDNGTTDGADDFMQDTATIGVNVVAFVPETIEGSVYLDTNNDGNHNANERGIAGIKVTLVGRNIQGDDVSLMTTTGLDGSYAFANLVPGDYTVSAAQASFLSDGTDTLGNQGTGTTSNDQHADINLPIFGFGGGPRADGNRFGERGIKPQYISLRDTFTGASNNGLYIGTNVTGDQFWLMLLDGWDGAKAVAIIPTAADYSTATIRVTDANDNVIERSVDRSNIGYRVGHDDDGAVIHLDGTPDKFGFPSLTQNGAGEGEAAEAEGEFAEIDEQLASDLSHDHYADFAAAVDRLMANFG